MSHITGPEVIQGDGSKGKNPNDFKDSDSEMHWLPVRPN